MPRDFRQAVNDLDEERFQLLYGRWDPLKPAAFAALLTASTPVRWHVAGGRAARVGAEPRHHDDTDVAVAMADLGRLRQALTDWHLWEANDGALRPLLPEVPLTETCACRETRQCREWPASGTCGRKSRFGSGMMTGRDVHAMASAVPRPAADLADPSMGRQVLSRYGPRHRHGDGHRAKPRHPDAGDLQPRAT